MWMWRKSPPPFFFFFLLFFGVNLFKLTGFDSILCKLTLIIITYYLVTLLPIYTSVLGLLFPFVFSSFINFVFVFFRTLVGGFEFELVGLVWLSWTLCILWERDGGEMINQTWTNERMEGWLSAHSLVRSLFFFPFFGFLVFFFFLVGEMEWNGLDRSCCL